MLNQNHFLLFTFFAYVLQLGKVLHLILPFKRLCVNVLVGKIPGQIPLSKLKIYHSFMSGK